MALFSLLFAVLNFIFIFSRYLSRYLQFLSSIFTVLKQRFAEIVALRYHCCICLEFRATISYQSSKHGSAKSFMLPNTDNWQSVAYLCRSVRS